MPGTSRESISTGISDLPCLGSWQSVAFLGQGRWSRVYRARPRAASPASPADYVIKVADPVNPSDLTTARKLLIRETLLGRAVSHPHLTCILTSHLNQPPYFLVMPFLEGDTVEAALAPRRPIPVPQALRIVRQTADAARALHRHGWLHGDIKPSNLLVTPESHVTLLDLGLARAVGLPETASDQPLSGTLGYLAPEAFGDLVELGPPSDVYSLGVTLYRLLTAELPFPAREAAELAEAHLHCAPPDPRQFNPRLSPALARLVLRMLAKPPGQRPSVDRLIAELVALEIATFDQRSAA